MSKIKTRHVFTSESVSEGHPDKVCDQISDGVLDACLAQDPNSRVACECLVATNLVVLAGELTTKAKVDFEKVARETIKKIGYTDTKINFSAQEAQVQVHLHNQSADIAQGVNAETAAEKEQGAGDQGMMFGYASNETPELMPAPILYSHRILERFAEIRRAQPAGSRFLQPDAKSQVSILYEGGKPVRVTTVVVSHQHTENVGHKELLPLVKQVVAEVIPASLRGGEITYHVNPTGKFVIGGPDGDSGLTGRKIIVDTYGGVGCHGGGAFSGKDPSKVDRSAAYMCRYIAKNVVAAGLADKCEVQVSYAIGLAKPLSVCVDTFGTIAKGLSEARLQEIVESESIFNLRPAAIIAKLGLKTPAAGGWSYQQTAAYGHFGRPQFPWEKTDQVAALRAAAGLKG
jgi:S-adenosylmethionine synthetase